MKKIISLVLALALVMSLAIGAAAETTAAGTITIGDAVQGQTYTAYKVFSVTYNTDKTTYNYSINSDSAFFDTVSAFAGIEENGLTLTQVGTGNTYNVTVDATKFNQDKAAALAAALNSDTTKPTAAGSVTASDTATIAVSELGYYFVDSTLGSLCSLDTTNNDVTIYEKNIKPSLTKLVEEDATKDYGETASANIGQSLNFKLTVNTGTNTNTTASGVDANYIITDELPAGMTFGSITSVKGNGVGWTEEEYYTVSSSGQVVTITLKADKVQALGQNKNIEIIYTAALNENAVIAGEGNKNTAYITFNGFTTSDAKADAIVYTYAMALEKYNTAGANLADAVFTFPFVATQVQAGSENTPAVYKVNVATEGTTDITTPASGNIVVIGLDDGTYSVVEKTAPAGYNELTAAISVPVNATSVNTVTKTFTTSDNKTVTFNAETDDGNYQIAADSIVGVENQTGTELPSTGGMGTTIFYILGGLMTVGALVLLVTKKRMAAE